MSLFKMAAAVTAAVSLLTLCGCGNNSGSSADGSSSSAAGSQQAVQPASKQSEFTTADGLFTLKLNERFSKYEGVYPAEFEFLFVDSESDASVGIMEMSDLHISPRLYCETVKEHYEELYGTVTSTAADANGLPAHLLEAEFTDEEDAEKNELRFCHKAIGYGNGDLLVLVITVPKDAADTAAEVEHDIMEGITYLGEPLKSADEVHENEFFSVTADKNWYFHSKDENEATLRPNIADTTTERFGSLKISAEKTESSANELSAADAAEFSANEKIEQVQTSKTTMLGHDAVCVSCVLKSEFMDLTREIYYFDNNGAIYKVQILVPTEDIDEFRQMVQPVTDTIKLK